MGRHAPTPASPRGFPGCRSTPTTSRSTPQAELADPDSVFHHFRKLIELRHDHPVIVHGRFELLLPDDEQIWALTRTLDDQILVMVANCSSDSCGRAGGCCCPTRRSRVLLATHGDSTSLDLQPWESRDLSARLSRSISAFGERRRLGVGLAGQPPGDGGGRAATAPRPAAENR